MDEQTIRRVVREELARLFPERNIGRQYRDSLDELAKQAGVKQGELYYVKDGKAYPYEKKGKVQEVVYIRTI